MRPINLCNCVVVLMIVYFSNTKVDSVKIECIPLDNCPFAINLLSKKHVSRTAEEVLNLFRISKCGHDEETNKLKIWCTKFTNCRTPDYKFGTCIPPESCTILAEILRFNLTAELKTRLSEYKCNLPGETEVLVCCPWSASNSDSNTVKQLALWNQESTGPKRRNANQPWFTLSNGNSFYDPSQNLPFYQNGHSTRFDSENHNNGLAWSNFGQTQGNSFNQQNTNFFDAFRSNQANFQDSFQQQSKWLQNALQNTSKQLLQPQQKTSNLFANWWSWFPGKSRPDRYNLTEETSDSTKETCMTPDHFEETCKEYPQCPTFLRAIRTINKTNSVHVEYLKKFNCSSTASGILKVCCPEQEIVFPGDVTATGRPELGAEERISNPLDSVSNICGRQIIDNKIIGGSTTDLAEFPWTAVLQYSTPKGLTFGCGGSIISNRYIITAAHCVNLNILRQAGLENLQRVVLGEYDRRNETDCIYTRYGSDCADPPQIFGVARIIEHELFRSNATPNDIALVKVDKDINFSNYVRPICLPTRNSLNLKGDETFAITGWGRTETGDSSPVKRKAYLPFVNKDQCGQLGPLTDGQICLGSGKGVDSCKGDSGGPVMYSIASSGDIVTTLVGIISFGFGTCGTTTSVSTSVTYYLDWISKNMS